MVGLERFDVRAAWWLSALPSGDDAFEKAPRYCYSANFEIPARSMPPRFTALLRSSTCSTRPT
jgi:hypothetical protein